MKIKIYQNSTNQRPKTASSTLIKHHTK